MNPLCDLLQDIKDAHGNPNPEDTLEQKYQKLVQSYQKSLQENERLQKYISELCLENVELADSNYFLKSECRTKGQTIFDKTARIKILSQITEKQEDQIDLLKREKFELFSINSALEKENLEISQHLENNHS